MPDTAIMLSGSIFVLKTHTKTASPVPPPSQPHLRVRRLTTVPYFRYKNFPAFLVWRGMFVASRT